MPAAELDRLFTAFRRTRDARLLATLFERTSPWLLHRARLLVGRANLAEDVVQDVFLGLLENGHGCEPGRPCLPYLLGILHRKAARVRRREARTLAQSLRDAAAPDTPVDAAVSAEGRAAVRTAIDALPEPYREVVRRFVAQQSPQAIGRDLGRTPNAVRVQLHRGLRLLRTALPPALLALLWTVPAQRLPAQAPRRRPLHVAAAVFVVCGLTTWIAGTVGRVDVATAHAVAANGSSSADAQPRDTANATATPFVRSQVEVAASAALVLELRHADGAPAESVGVSVHRAGHDPDFGTALAVSGADGRVVLRDVPFGPVTVSLDRGVQIDCSVPPSTLAPQIVTLPAGIDVTGVVHDAHGRPAEGAGVWLCRDSRTPTEGSVVAHAGAGGRFVLRGVPPTAFVGAVHSGSVPSTLHTIVATPGSRTCELQLVLGGIGARVTGRVVDVRGSGVADAVVRIARHPRARFRLPGGSDAEQLHACTVARTDASGQFSAADLPSGTMQLLVRAPAHRTALESIVLVPGVEHRVELRVHGGRTLDGDVRDEHGASIAGASVLARGLVRSAWASVSTAPDGSFALGGLDPDRVLLEVVAPGFAPASLPVPRESGRIDVVLRAEARVVLRLVNAADSAVSAAEWEVAAIAGPGEHDPLPEPLAPDGDSFVAAGALAAGPFFVRRHGTQVWLRAEPTADPTVLRVPSAAERVGSLQLSLAGITPEQRRGVVLVVERDGVRQPLVAAEPSDAAAPALDFGRVPCGDLRAVLYSRAGLLPAVDLGVVAVGESNAAMNVAVPEHGWLRYRLQRTDREPVLQCSAFVTDAHGMLVPLDGTDGRIALAAGHHQLWASSLSFPTIGHAFAVNVGRETLVDLQLSPARARHVAFRLPPDADPRQCRARVRSADDAPRAAVPDFPIAGRGFDTTADGLCYTTLVLGDGEYYLDVQCGSRAFRSVFDIAGDEGVAEPIEVRLGAND